MKHGLLALNGILLAAVAFLFYLQFSGKKTKENPDNNASHNSAAQQASFRIAYFEIDSVDANCDQVKDIRAEISKKQLSINMELERLDKSYRDKFNNYQDKAATMTQLQSEQATNDLLQSQENMKSRRMALDKEYNDFVTRRMQEVKSRIEEFLKEYNRDKGYSYIVSYEPGLFYLKDTLYNITDDVVKGLNAMYGKKKK
jgi:outer membrane protein